VEVTAPQNREVYVSSFLALYRGETISAAKIVAVSASPELITEFAERMMGEPEEPGLDPVLKELEHGRRRALQLVKSGAE
jgi:hypothetical protein